MAKYRIRIEALDPAEELRAEYRMGIECDGFTIITDNGDRTGITIHEMSRDAIATTIAQDEDLLSAAIVAKAMAEANRMEREMKSSRVIDAFVARIGREDK